MFKKLLFTSFLSGLLIAPSVANGPIFTEEDLRILPTKFSEVFGGRKVTIDFGKSNETSKIIIKDGTCAQYWTVLRYVSDTIKTKKMTGEVTDKLGRIGFAARRQMDKVGCNL